MLQERKGWGTAGSDFAKSSVSPKASILSANSTMKAVAWAWTWHSCPDWSFSLASLSPSQPSKKYCYCRTAMLRDLYGCWICTRKTHEKPPSERNQIWSSRSDTGRKQLAWYGSWNGSGTIIRFNSFHQVVPVSTVQLVVIPLVCTFCPSACVLFVFTTSLKWLWDMFEIYSSMPTAT